MYSIKFPEEWWEEYMEKKWDYETCRRWNSHMKNAWKTARKAFPTRSFWLSFYDVGQGEKHPELAREILSLPGKEEGLLGLYHCTRQELLQIRGVGEVKAIQLQCIGELSKRMAAAGARKGLCFHDPASIADYYMERLRHEDQEVLLCMMLDNKNQLLGEKEITRGTVNATMISPRELFLAALQFRAVHILLVHNHPSGIPEPSGDDITVTRQIRRAGEMLGITLLDHIIIGDHCYTSMLEQGI